MKVFILGLIAAVGLAVVAAFVMEDTLSRTADATFSTPSARVGESGAVATRHFDGR